LESIKQNNENNEDLKKAIKTMISNPSINDSWKQKVEPALDRMFKNFKFPADSKYQEFIVGSGVLVDLGMEFNDFFHTVEEYLTSYIRILRGKMVDKIKKKFDKDNNFSKTTPSADKLTRFNEKYAKFDDVLRDFANNIFGRAPSDSDKMFCKYVIYLYSKDIKMSEEAYLTASRDLAGGELE